MNREDFKSNIVSLEGWLRKQHFICSEMKKLASDRNSTKPGLKYLICQPELKILRICVEVNLT